MNPFTRPVHPEDIGELIDLTVEGDSQTQSMAKMQGAGIASLYNILCENPFAYLADEVGMGKTYQALGLAALVWNEQPDARILFLSPRQNLQEKWYTDYKQFFASNYRRRQRFGDDRAASILFRQPVNRPELFHNLRSWTSTISRPERIAPFLRHTSFTRPIFVTSREVDNVSELWVSTIQKLRSWGLFDIPERPRELSPENASEQLNLAFAEALNRKLANAAGSGPYFDLVILDEAQCLRNPHNQTNDVLFKALRGRVKKWLFMSATPVHSGPADLPRILNHYPDCGEVLDPKLVDDLPAMQAALQPILVRRQRQYCTMPKGAKVGKTKYRNHDLEEWAVHDNQMGTLATLALGLVQKGLVDVLHSRGNRYQIGFLSSFESLQASIRGAAAAPESDADAQEQRAQGDWHYEQAEGVPETDAPDTNFIHRLALDFDDRFGMPLPHPKVDAVVSRVARLAFGSDTEQGGQKFIIFTRRVSTVYSLRDRLNRLHQRSIEARIRRCWGVELDWSGKGDGFDNANEVEDPEGFDAAPGESPFREAMSNKGWLFRYRQTFRASGRNTLFFEDGWLQRLCDAGGVAPDAAAAAISDKLWAESWAHSSRPAGKSRQQHRADRVRYLAVQSIRREPEAFGLDERTAAPWKLAYEAALHDHLDPVAEAGDPHRAPELFTEPTLWTVWDQRFPDGALALPVPKPSDAGNDADAHQLFSNLCRRQVVRTILSQTIRLTDTLIDLYCADEKSADHPGAFPNRFLDWLDTDDPGALQVQHECAQWIEHLRLIVDSCLDGAGRGWPELARKEEWDNLYNPMAIMGVTGGSGAHRTATRQFRTPSFPRVIVCTDTLKEGVDLHLFCDRVLHYGVAWTSGDLEQRVGRVDRFFSLIERRLAKSPPPTVQLHVGYPHVVASLERQQVDRVIERQIQAELLMDSPLAGSRHERKDLVIDSTARKKIECKLGPYEEPGFPRDRRSVVQISRKQAESTANHYARWYRELRKALERQEWNISPDDDNPVRVATLYKSGAQHNIEWVFDSFLARYVITLTGIPWENEAKFSGGKRRRKVDRARKVESFLRLLVPTPDEGIDDGTISRLLSVLSGQHPQADANAVMRWGSLLASWPNGFAEWLSNYKARVTVVHHDCRRKSRQGVMLYIYKSSVRIVGVVADLDELEHRGEWGGEPTTDNVRDWALDVTDRLTVGYLDVHDRKKLVFGCHVIHGNLSEESSRRLVEEIAWRSDAWREALTGSI